MIVLLHRPYKETVWADITNFLGGKVPDLDDSEINTRAKFDLDLQEYDDQILSIDTGDDLALVQYDSSGNYLGIINEKFDGKVCLIDASGYSNNNYSNDGIANKFTYRIQIQQRNFAVKPFEITYDGIVMAYDLFAEVFQQWVRSDLGGIFEESGNIVNRYELLFEDFEVINYSFKGNAESHLKEICNRYQLSWELLSKSEEHSSNTIERFYTVRVWQE